ncbi:protein NEGATIVE REGULATOR OF RESISTANCE-like [Typha latifolia]|uniref:protein NEGATIVE REGULATOR OF RESISTANCE-like n=1 Tax=Typha latifolia TaxID=4733 RepID=UPI003C2FEE6F
MDSSSSKRKRRADGSSDERRLPAKPRGEWDASNEVTDAEVEEFYAILRRMRDASRCLANGDNASPAPAAAPADGAKGVGRWSPAFALEDFVTDAVKDDDVRPKQAAAVKPAPRRIDLNADPEPEGMAVASPRGEATARISSAQA